MCGQSELSSAASPNLAFDEFQRSPNRHARSLEVNVAPFEHEAFAAAQPRTDQTAIGRRKSDEAAARSSFAIPAPSSVFISACT